MNDYMKDPQEFMEEQKRKNEEARNAALKNASLGPNGAVQSSSGGAVRAIVTVFVVFFIFAMFGIFIINFLKDELFDEIENLDRPTETVSLMQAEDEALDSLRYLAELSSKKDNIHMAVTTDTCQKVAYYYMRKMAKNDTRDFCSGESIWVASEKIGTHVNVYLMDASQNILLATTDFAYTEISTMAFYVAGGENSQAISGSFTFKEAKF